MALQVKRLAAPVGMAVILLGVVLALGNRIGFWKTFPLSGTIAIFLGFVLTRVGRDS